MTGHLKQKCSGIKSLIPQCSARNSNTVSSCLPRHGLPGIRRPLLRLVFDWNHSLFWFQSWGRCFNCQYSILGQCWFNVFPVNSFGQCVLAQVTDLAHAMLVFVLSVSSDLQHTQNKAISNEKPTLMTYTKQNNITNNAIPICKFSMCLLLSPNHFSLSKTFQSTSLRIHNFKFNTDLQIHYLKFV